MERVLLVGLGGFVGSIVRFLLSGVSHTLFPRSTFPIGTMIVNLYGCLIIGLISQLAESRNAFTDLTIRSNNGFSFRRHFFRRHFRRLYNLLCLWKCNN